MVLAAQGAQAEQRLIGPIWPSAESQSGEAANAMAAMSTILVRRAPQRGGAGSVDLATRATTQGMTGLFEGLAHSDVSFSSQGAGYVAVTPWVELSGLQSDDNLRRYEALVLELGADASLGNGLTLGASVALVRSKTESLLDFSDQTGEGEGYVVTLSALYEAGGWTAEAALRFSQTDYSRVLLGTAGKAESNGAALRLSVSRAFDLGNGGTLSPTASIVTGR